MTIALGLALMSAQPASAEAQSAPAASEVQSPEAQAVDWEKEFGVVRNEPDPVTGELPVEPYVQSPKNAGAAPFDGPRMAEAFGGQEGIRKIVNRLVELNIEDPRIADIFRNQDLVRLKRTLFEQFCFILNAGCIYTGRDMKAAHKDLGTTRADLNALVENLQQAMAESRISFPAQNRFLAKLAPLDGDVTTR